MKKSILCFMFAVLFLFQLEAKADPKPGTIVFCQAANEDVCYYPMGQFESKQSMYGTSFVSKSGQNIFFRAYSSSGAFGTKELRFNLYRNGQHLKGRIEGGYDPSWVATFGNLNTLVHYKGKPYLPGKYKLEVAKKVSSNKQVVIAEGHFTIR